MKVFRTKVLACGLVAFVVYSMTPGCVIRFGPSAEGDSTGDGTDTGATPENPVTPEPTPEDEAAAAFAQVDPQQLALAEAKASLTTAYLVAQAESSGIDPSTLDAVALEQLMQQYPSRGGGLGGGVARDAGSGDVPGMA
ncbi:hypothetical protein [Sorangium sp. So ce426]|uniref:hypothetical protein n=1 Tax=Sorangium sp. So ce426 TaxID=3133312 RepID=UPI003F5C5EB2